MYLRNKHSSSLFSNRCRLSSREKATFRWLFMALTLWSMVHTKACNFENSFTTQSNWFFRQDLQSHHLYCPSYLGLKQDKICFKCSIKLFTKLQNANPFMFTFHIEAIFTEWRNGNLGNGKEEDGCGKSPGPPCLSRCLPQILPESIREIIRLLTKEMPGCFIGVGCLYYSPGNSSLHLMRHSPSLIGFYCAILKAKFLMYSKSLNNILSFTVDLHHFCSQTRCNKANKTVSSKTHHDRM